MKRRELIQMGSALVGGASLAMLTGCSKEEKNILDSNNNQISVDKTGALSITPKQTAMYEYSSPMPLDKKLIDELYKFNKTLKKGKITTLFSSLPSPLAESIHPVLRSPRGSNLNIKTIEDYTDLVKYSIKKGFTCVYALNTTRPITDDMSDSVLRALGYFIDKLYKVGVKDVKIANPALLALFKENAPYMNLHLATTAEYHSSQIYNYVLKEYPNIKSINTSTDDNHNFDFLYSMRKLFPNVRLELLVNECICVKYCMSRFYHQCTNSIFSGFPCKAYIKSNPHLHIARTNTIYPWELEYYSAIGINKFKFTCFPYNRANIQDIDYLKHYLLSIENGIENYKANDLLSKIYNKFDKTMGIKFKDNMKLSELIKQLPDINYFIKNGARCSSDCGTRCKYCYNIAENLKKYTEKYDPKMESNA